MKSVERQSVKSDELFPDTPGRDSPSVLSSLTALLRPSAKKDDVNGKEERSSFSWKKLLEENVDKAVFEDRPVRPSADRRASASVALEGNSTRPNIFRQRSYSIARKAVSNEVDDPLKKMMQDAVSAADSQEEILPDAVALSPTDEYKVINSIADAAKRITTGSVMSIPIDFSSTGSLRLGVKDLHGGILVVSVLKRTGGTPGPAETSGVCLGDVIMGVNFQLCRDGSQGLSAIMKALHQRGETSITMQLWRPHRVNMSMSNAEFFPKIDDMFIQAHTMFRNKIFTNWERSNFLDNLLRYMEKESTIARKINALKAAEMDELERTNQVLKLMKQRRAYDNEILDLERNIFQAKGLRSALSVRIVHTKLVLGDNSEKVVVYVLRVEDIDSGLQWTVQWRYRDFFRLFLELGEICILTKDLPFPKKRFVGNSYVVEERIVALEQYIRSAVSILTFEAVSDISASRGLRHLQGFLGVGRYLDCLRPPKMDDQRCLELMAYKHLNEPSSPSCQYVRRFVATVNLDSKVGPGPLGYKPVLEFVFDALSEVEQFTMQNHGQMMTQVIRDRRSDLTEDQIKSFVRRCVRRQVESAVFLPLRRTLLRIVYSFISVRAEKLNKAMESLRHASPKYFYIDECASRCKSLAVAAKAFRDLVQAYLPADQGQYLIKAAITVMVVQAECVSIANGSASTVKSRNSAGEKGASDQAPAPPSSGVASATLSDDTAKPSGSSSPSPVRDPAVNKKHMFWHSEDLAGQLLMRNLDGTPVQKSDLGAIDVNQLKMRVMNEDVGSEPASPSSEVMLDSNHSLVDVQNAILEPKPAHERDGGHGSLPSVTERDGEGESFGEEQGGVTQGRYAGGEVEDDDSGGEGAAEPTFSDPVEVRAVFSEAMNISQLDFEHSTTGAVIAGGDLAVDAAQLAEMDAVRRARGASAAAAAAAARARFGSQSSPSKDLDRLNALASTAAQGSAAEQSDVSAGKESNSSNNNIGGGGGGGATSGGDDSRGPGAPSKRAEGGFYDSIDHDAVVSADDFLPMFTYVLVQSQLPQILLVKELMTALMDSEEAYGECGYYMATLEAATQHIIDIVETRNAEHGGV